MGRFFLYTILTASGWSALAQAELMVSSDSASDWYDSVFHLDEVPVVGIDLTKFSSGTVLTEVIPDRSGALSSIGANSTIHFKNYGNQQLSTIAFRGTSASHTNVLWNGIQVNSPTLGQTDFSVWPMFLTDRVLIQHGGGSSLLGSGAIGGSIIVDNSQFQKDSLVTYYGALGSFGQYDGGIKIRLDLNERLQIEYRGFYGQLENDFPLEGGGRQVHAGVNRFGLSHKLKYTSANGILFSEIAYVENDREIQPTVTSASRSTLLTKNFRAVVNQLWEADRGDHDITAGVIKDETVFNDSIVTSSYRSTGTYSFNRSFSPYFHFRVGGTFIHEWAESENFSIVERRNQFQFFSSATVQPFRKLGITGNVRHLFAPNEDVFIPSVGFEYAYLSTNRQSITFRGQASRDFRVPTFNDFFWVPGGNPDLRSERSYNFEAGLDLRHDWLTAKLTGFYAEIEDWIQWRPIEGIWSPRNLRKVNTHGIEVNLDAKLDLNDVLFTASAVYTYVRSEDQGLTERNQLPYVPEHELFGQVTTSYKGFYMNARANFTGVRYTTLTNSLQSEIDEFLLFDTAIGRSFDLKDVALDVRLSTNNIFDINYQVVKNHAMPGRSFLIELTTKF